MINNYLRYRLPPVHSKLFENHRIPHLHTAINEILNRADKYMGLYQSLEDAGLTLNTVQFVSSLRQDSFLLRDGNSCGIYLDYEAFSEFHDFSLNGPTLSRSLHRLAASAYFSSDFDLALRIRFLHSSVSVLGALNFSATPIVPHYGEAYFTTSLIAHEVGHIFYLAETELNQNNQINTFLEKMVDDAASAGSFFLAAPEFKILPPIVSVASRMIA